MPVKETFLAFLDTETTGLIPGKDEIVEIATILTDMQMNEVGRFHQKIVVDRFVPPEVQAINGYDAALWAKEAVDFVVYREWLARQIPFGHVAIPVGHNVGFDRDMIDLRYYKPAKRFCPLSYHKIDTVALAMAMRVAGLLGSVPDVRLATVAEALGIPHEAHRAMGDCMAAMAIFKRTALLFASASKAEKATA